MAKNEIKASMHILEAKIIREWWDEKIVKARTVFFTKFVFGESDSDRFNLLKRCCKSPTKTKSNLNEKTYQHVREICDYHDRIGYLEATGLIDAGNVLPATLHSMRKTWLAIAAFVYLVRKPTANGVFDPIFMCGFEELFTKSAGMNAYQSPSVWYRDKFEGCQLMNFDTLDDELRNIEEVYIAKIKEQDKEAGFEGKLPY